MVYHLSIAQPCHEDWNTMVPDQEGKHCLQCCKTVVDFTDWTTDEIAAYLQARNYKDVCGRFRETQLSQDYIAPDIYVQQVHRSGLSYIKRVAAIVLFALFLSVNSQAQTPHGQQLLGEPAMVATKADSTATDTLKQSKKPERITLPQQRREPMIMGFMVPVHQPVKWDTTRSKLKK